MSFLSVAVLAALAAAAGTRAPQLKPRPAAPPKATPKVDPEFDRLAKAANAARDASRLDEAVALYRQALKRSPQWAEGRWSLGTLAYASDDFETCRDSLAHLVRLEPKAARAWTLLGLCQFRLSRYEESLASLMRAEQIGRLGSSELDRSAMYHMAILLNRAGRFEHASKYLFALARQGREEAQIVLATGIAAVRKPLLPSELADEDRQFLMQLGGAVRLVGRKELPRAEAEVRKLIEQYPKRSELHYVLGGILLQTDPDAALAAYMKELELTPGHLPSLIQITSHYLDAGELENAMKYAQQGVKAEPASYASRYMLAKVLLDWDRNEEAIEQLEIARSIAPNIAQVHFALAGAYRKTGREADAARSQADFVRLKEVIQPGLVQQ